MSLSLTSRELPDNVTRRTVGRHVYVLSGALAVVGAIAAGLSLFVPSLLTGTDVTNGNTRGTALVMLVVGIPTLLISMWFASRGSWRGRLVWLGVLAYLAYNGVLFAFAAPFNSLFLLYVATLSLAVFSIASLVGGTDPNECVPALKRATIKGLAIYTWTIVFINALVWLRGIVANVGAANPGAFLAETGLTTNPSYVQDLVFWLPMAALAAYWLWQEKPWGVALVGSWLVYGLIESIGVASDQWFGYHADPSTEFASVGGMGIFIALALIGTVPLYLFYRASKGGIETL
ncbi:MAG: hypothetical protein WA726_06970 [Acidimicrobiia bacterium]